jgi:hypothetical protein
MALVGSYCSGATIDITMEHPLWGAIKDKAGPKDARADRRCGAGTVKVIRGVARSTAQSDGRLQPARSQGHRDQPGYVPGLVVLCPSLGSHLPARLEEKNPLEWTRPGLPGAGDADGGMGILPLIDGSASPGALRRYKRPFW